MHIILDRVQGFLEPFQCQFAILSPVQPPRVRKRSFDLPPELWLEIFQFATYVHRSATIKPMDPFTHKRTSNNVMGLNTPALALQTKLALVNVCKSWRRLAMPILYQHIDVRSPARAELVLWGLEQSRKPDRLHSPIALLHNYGQWTRHIEVFTHARGCSNIKYLQIIFSIFRCCPNLRVLSGIWIHSLPTEFLDAISKMYGPSLRGMYWNETSEKMNRNQQPITTSATFSFLTSFKQLRALDLRHFKPKDPLGPLLANSTRPILPLVEDLVISTHSWSLSTASHIALPRLRSLTVKTNIPDNTDHYQLGEFLKVHGFSLESVDLPLPSPDDEVEPDSSVVRRTAKHINPDIFLDPDVCPNLVSIVFPATSPTPSEHVHPTLRRIGLRGIRADSLYPGRPGTAKMHLDAIDCERYPNLELIQTIGFLVEADVDSLIKDVFIWWVEKFERQGINFLDGEGVLWQYTDGEVFQDTVFPINLEPLPSEAEGQKDEKLST